MWSHLLILLFYCCFTCNCSEDDWTLYESQFTEHNREEIYVSNVTTTELLSNITVLKWKTLNSGFASYTAGLVNDTMLAVLVSTLSNKELKITSKVYDLGSHKVADIELVEQWIEGLPQVYVVAFIPTEGVYWYALSEDSFLKVWKWNFEDVHQVSGLQAFHMNNEDFLLMVVEDQNKDIGALIYSFNVVKSQRRFIQFIPLPHHSPSVCFSSLGKSYLSFTQPPSGTLLIYQLSNSYNFTKLKEIPSTEIDQVICFEDIFKSFIAFNGLNATIFEITEPFGLVERKIANSNLNSLQFWLPLKVNRFRDETILMFQRIIDHSTHETFDVEMVTSNGRRFEEHMDIPCQLFGENHETLECITDFNPQSGLQGSSYIAIEKHLALVVSSADKGTAIFNMDMALKKLEHPAKEKLEEFLERKLRIEESLREVESFTDKREQISFTQDTPTLRTGSATRNSNFTDDFTEKLDPFDVEIEKMAAEIDALNEKLNQIKNRIKEGVFDTVIFNGAVEVQGTLESEALTSTDEEFNKVFDNIARKNDLKQVKGPITFKQPVSVEELYFETFNGVPKEDYLVHNGSIELTDVTFENLVTVEDLIITEDMVNDVNINEWITSANNVTGSLKFEKIVTESFTTNLLNNRSIANASTTGFDILDQSYLLIPGNVTVTTINGENFEDLLTKICYKNVKCQIDKLHVTGNVNILENIEGLNYLSDLKFPEDYVDLNSNETLLITGEKHFLNTLQADTVTSEHINNLDLSKVISLSEERNVTGNLTFDNLEVLDSIEVLGETNLISEEDRTEVYEELNVLGDVIITGNFNGVNFDEYLDEFISKNDNTTITITGAKTFPQGLIVHKNLEIQSESINNISLDSFITKTTNQDLYLDTIRGNVDFDSLTVGGLFDGHNITELDQNLIKLNDTELITSKLVFEDAVSVDTLEVLDEFDEFTEDVELDELVADSVEVQGNIEGQVEGVDLDELRKYRESQTVIETLAVSELSCENLIAEFINNVSAQDKFNYTQVQEMVSDLLLYRNATVDTLIVNGNLNLKSVNSKDFTQVLEDHIWTKIYRNSSNLIIDGDVHFESLQIKQLVNVDFNDFVRSLVFKNDTEVKISNTITFVKGITVKNLLETSTINKIKLENILRKSAWQTLKGSLRVLGNVTIEDDVTVQGMINNVEVAYLLNNFEIGEEVLKVKDEMLLLRLPYIRNLTIKGLVNQQDLNQVFSNLVYLDKDIQLDQDIVFANEVHIEGNLSTEEGINNINFTEFFSRVALINGYEEFLGSINFTSDTDILGSVDTEDCQTNLLTTKKFEEEINRGVFVNKGFLPGLYNFQNMSILNGLRTKLVNDLDMEDVIPLKTAQQLKTLNITKMSVTRDVEVSNLVNGVKLEEEKEKTVMSNVEQTIPGEVVFRKHVLVYDQINAERINGKPVEKIVTINTDQTLSALYNFDTKLFVNGDVSVGGLINEVNLTEWKEDSLQTNSNETQIVTGNLTVDTLDLSGPVEGTMALNDFNATQLVLEVEEKTMNMTDLQRRILEDFSNLCNQLTYIYEQLSSKFLMFDYFEELKTVQFLKDINYVKHFKHQDGDYLLVNEKESCHTHLMKFEINSGFLDQKLIVTGVVKQIEVITGNEELFLVARREEMSDICPEDSNSDVVWKFVDEDLDVVDILDHQDLLQSSLQPLTFYGMRQGDVIEFKLNSSQATVLNEFRKWDISESNATFFPRGLQTGLAIQTAQELISLHQENIRNVEKYNFHTTSVLIGNFSKQKIEVDLGRSDVAVVKAGVKGGLRSFLAVARQTKSEIGKNQDFIEIYSDPLKGELFQRIQTYRPASPVSVEFGNGETLLAFMENSKILQIYEYKGIMGFKHRSSIKIPATSMFLIDLPIGQYSQPRKVLGLIHNNQITFLQPQMFGRVVPDGLQCSP